MAMLLDPRRRRTFNSLSRDHIRPDSKSLVMKTLEAFNSLSRDHMITRHSLKCSHTSSFQVLSTPSLGITKLERSHVHQIFTGSFNSLSRDHEVSQAPPGSRFRSRAFNSLSRDHKDVHC